MQGVASAPSSTDFGRDQWTQLTDAPILKPEYPGTWNLSESGHPHLFKDEDGGTYLFYQGNNDNGKTWYISKIEVKWNDNGPYLQ